MEVVPSMDGRIAHLAQEVLAEAAVLITEMGLFVQGRSS